MGTITEIEAAIQRLPRSQVDELAVWLEEFRAAKKTLPTIDKWLDGARGAAKSDLTTDQHLALTRGEG